MAMRSAGSKLKGFSLAKAVSQEQQTQPPDRTPEPGMDGSWVEKQFVNFVIKIKIIISI